MLPLGRNRAMTYRIAIYTGLRAGEIASLKLADAHLDANPPAPLPAVVPHARDEGGSNWPTPQGR